MSYDDWRNYANTNSTDPDRLSRNEGYYERPTWVEDKSKSNISDIESLLEHFGLPKLTEKERRAKRAEFSYGVKYSSPTSLPPSTRPSVEQNQRTARAFNKEHFGTETTMSIDQAERILYENDMLIVDHNQTPTYFQKRRLADLLKYKKQMLQKSDPKLLARITEAYKTLFEKHGMGRRTKCKKCGLYK